jgi:cytochrome oxidase assembly protein ShyY1
MRDDQARPLPDSMWEVARRPRWIGMLALALAVAALFAWLGHWQLDRSVDSLKPVSTGSETSTPLSDLTSPQSKYLDKFTGQKVTVTGAFDKDDFRVISGRLNHSDSGYWLVGRFVDSSTGGSLAVALGWGATAADARDAIPSVPVAPTTTALAGRYLPSEAASEGKFQEGRETVVAVPQLINQWSDFSGDVYNGYVVADRSWGDLTAIYSPPPIDKTSINFLNLFYAIEWVVFAGFAIFLWFRLVRDAFEREIEEAEEARALLEGGSPQASLHAD